MADQIEHAEAEALVNELQKKLDRLRVLYEQYFLGISKREPSIPLKDVVRLVHALDRKQIRNTGLRFRLRNLIQKFQVQRTYWARTIRQIEAGTYKRDIARVRRKYARQGVEMPELGKMRTAAEVEKAMKDAAEQAHKIKKQAPPGRLKKKPVADIRGVSADELRKKVSEAKGEPLITDADADQALDALFGGDAPAPPSEPAPSAPPAPAPPAPAPPAQATAASKPAAAPPPVPKQPPPRRAPTPPPSRSVPPRPAKPTADPAVESLYRRMVKAKRMVGQSGDSVSREGIARTLASQMPKLKQMHPGKEIDFQVVIRKGKVVLKARPK